MAWADDAHRDQDGVYGLEFLPENGDEPEPRATRELRTEHGEAIGDDRARRIPRAVRIVGLLVVVAAFAVALWPTSGTTPGPEPLRIRLAGAELAPAGRITTLTLVLANDAPSAASVGEAEIRDADGRRIGSDRSWPAGDIPAGSTLAVDIPVPYVCDTHLPPRLPVALHVSVSTPRDAGPPRDLSYQVDAQTWQRFEAYQSGICDSGGSAAVKVGAISVAEADRATRSIKILTQISVPEPLTVDRISAANQTFQVSADPEPPLILPAGGWQTITTTWQVSDCAAMADQWNKKPALLLAYEGPTGGTSVAIDLPAQVVAQLSTTTCPH